MTLNSKIFLILLMFQLSIFSQSIDSITLDSSTQILTTNNIDSIEPIADTEIIENDTDTLISEKNIDTTVEITDTNVEIADTNVEIADTNVEIADTNVEIADTNVLSEKKADTIQSCSPKCRKGYVCVDGECQPIIKEQKTKAIDNKRKLKYTSKLGDLDRLFISTNIIYSIGSWYSAITPMIYSQKSWRRYSYYDEGHYDKFEVITYAPGSSVYITFGSMNLTQIGKSVSILKELGGKPAIELQTTGIILSSAAFATTAINITSIFLDNKTYTASTSLINAAMILSAYTVNTATYAVNRKRIKNTETFKVTDIKNSIDIAPYIYTDGKQSGAGLAFKF